MKKNEGILLVNKPAGKTSFSLVGALRRLTKIKTIGHAGTLDPFATGLVVLLIGRPYTRLSGTFLNQEKHYTATIYLGKETDTYDCTGEILYENPLVPSQDDVVAALKKFQGDILQTPPMYSAKKVDGKRLYTLARQGKTIERQACPVFIKTQLLSYNYPHIKLLIECSKGTYIRSLAYDLGKEMGCGAYLSELIRTKSGNFSLDNAVDGTLLFSHDLDIAAGVLGKICS